MHASSTRVEIQSLVPNKVRRSQKIVCCRNGRPVNVKHGTRCTIDKVGGKKNPKGVVNLSL